MSATPTDFSSLMQQVQAGDAGAVQDLIDRYGDHLLRIIRRRMHQRMRPLYDSQDFCQAVWASFFALPNEKYQFETPEKLAIFLGDLARNKVVEAIRKRLLAKKHDPNREVQLSRFESYEPLPSGSGFPTEYIPGRDPTPSAIVMARDEWEHLIRRQPEKYQRILALLDQGETHREVARLLGLNEKTIQRLLRKLCPGDAHEPR